MTNTSGQWRVDGVLLTEFIYKTVDERGCVEEHQSVTACLAIQSLACAQSDESVTSMISDFG